ncbi:anti-sigma factor family protein [Candidatus Omnitrophota bacterium]
MDCDNVRSLLPFLDDNSIKADNKKDVRVHLIKCEKCRQEYRNQEAMINRFQAAFPHNEGTCSPEFLAAVKTKINRKKEARILYRLALSAAAVIVFTIGVSLYSFLPGSTTQESAQESAVLESTTDFENYVANRYLDMYELSSLVDDSYEEEEADILQEYISSNYIDITPEDIIETMDDDELELALAAF